MKTNLGSCIDERIRSTVERGKKRPFTLFIHATGGPEGEPYVFVNPLGVFSIEEFDEVVARLKKEGFTFDQNTRHDLRAYPPSGSMVHFLTDRERENY